MLTALHNAEQGIRVLEDLLRRQPNLEPEQKILWFIHACILRAESKCLGKPGGHPEQNVTIVDGFSPEEWAGASASEGAH